MRTLTFLVPVLLFFISCDKVDAPFVKKTTATGSKFVTNTNAAVSNFKKALLEDYTGQMCPNCPAAAVIITNTLLPSYQNSLVVIAVHQGSRFAQPTAAFPNDFRTEAGEEWGSSKNFGVAFWPCGLINRKNYNSKGLLVINTSWNSIVSVAQNDPFVVKLDVRSQYDSLARALNLYVKGSFNVPYTNDVKLVAVYLQDGIVGKQIDGSKEIEEYEFEHMLRGDISGIWGVDLKKGPAGMNDTASVSFLNFSLPAQVRNIPVNDKQVSVVVFAYDAVTKNVLQAEKLKIIPPKSVAN